MLTPFILSNIVHTDYPCEASSRLLLFPRHDPRLLQSNSCAHGNLRRENQVLLLYDRG